MSTINKNFVIKNEHLETEKDLLPFLFGNKEIEFLESNVDMFDVLVLAGIFPSKGQARKNWTRTDSNIPKGFSDFTRIGKLKHNIYIWNPIKTI